MDTRKKKQKLRDSLLGKRRKLDEEQYRSKSAKIVARLKRLPEFQKADVLHCYVSMNRRREVDTLPLLRDLLESEKKVVVPLTDFETKELKHRYLESMDDLKKNKWGVQEPVAGKWAELPEIDLVVVPMVGGDLGKNRIGYGKGFYDRFLQKVEVPCIGLLFEQCLVKSIPVGKFDIPLTKLITEARIIT